MVGPISLGNHIDHRAVTQAMEALPHSFAYFADYPYILENFDHPWITKSHFVKLPIILNGESLKAWQDAVLCYASQLSGFWRDASEARLALRNYLAVGGGGLWEKSSLNRYSINS